MVSYAVTGASRGLGLELINQLSQTPSNIVFALVRNTISSPKLTAIAASNYNVHIIQGDLTSLSQLQEAAKRIEAVMGGAGLDVLINNGAYLASKTKSFLPTTLSNPENVEMVTASFRNSVDTNVLGAIHVTNTFLPLIRKGGQKKIVHVSSAMGDPRFVREARVVNTLSYSASKAMLNLVVAKYAVELAEQEVLVVALNPGWVDTDEGEVTPEKSAGVKEMARLFHKYNPQVNGRTTMAESVRDQLETIKGLTLEVSGRLISQHGNEDWF